MPPDSKPDLDQIAQDIADVVSGAAGAATAAKKKGAVELFKWLLGQQTNTIILILIGVGGFYSGRYLVLYGIPSHLTAIQAGYERLDENHRKEREETRKFFEHTLDRMEKAYSVSAAPKGSN